MAYRSWFLFMMVLVSASVVGERYMMAVMVGPIKAELQLSDTQIGLAKDLAIAIIYIIAVIPLARLADRWSKRKMVAVAATIWSVAVLFCGFAKNLRTKYDAEDIAQRLEITRYLAYSDYNKAVMNLEDAIGVRIEKALSGSLSK